MGHPHVTWDVVGDHQQHICLGFSVEPGSSFYHLTELLCPCQVHKASWHMWHYGGKTPKPHYAFANSRHIARLNAGKLKGWAKHKKAMEEHGESHTLVEKYTDSEGRQRWKGTSKLRGSELGPQLFQETFLTIFTWNIISFERCPRSERGPGPRTSFKGNFVMVSI